MLEAKARNAWHTVHARCFLKNKKGLSWTKGPGKAIEETAQRLPSGGVSSNGRAGRAFPTRGRT